MEVAQFLPILAFAAVLAATIAWIAAERRASYRWRIGIGILCVLGWIGWVLLVADIVPTYERSFHRRALRDLGSVLDEGNMELAQKAVAAYNDEVAASGSTYEASRRMLREIREAREIKSQ